MSGCSLKACKLAMRDKESLKVMRLNYNLIPRLELSLSIHANVHSLLTWLIFFSPPSPLLHPHQREQRTRLKKHEEEAKVIRPQLPHLK